MKLDSRSLGWFGVLMIAAGCSSGGGGSDDDDDSNAGSGGTGVSGSGGKGSGGSGGTGACDGVSCSGLDVCDPRDGECVECVRTGDCTGTDVCIDRACVSPDACSSTDDCANGLYCDTGAGSCVECLMDSHCGVGETCAESTCVLEGSGGTGGGSSGGTGGDGATGGSAGTGGSTGGTGGSTGGAGGSTGGSAGAGGSNAGTGGSNGGSGGAMTCTCSGGQECTLQGDCVDPDTIEDFADCDNSIIEVRGRSGAWYADGDTGINVMFAVSVPGSAWSDKSCAAWTTGGPIGSGSTTWGVLGVELADGSAYDVSDHGGISVRVESGQSFGVNITTTDGGNFQAALSATTGSQTFNLPWSSFPARTDSAVSTLDTSKVVGIQFTPDDPSMGYGIAVHAIFLN